MRHARMLISACYELVWRYSVTSGDVNLTSLVFSFFYSEKFLYQSMGNYKALPPLTLR